MAGTRVRTLRDTRRARTWLAALVLLAVMAGCRATTDSNPSASELGVASPLPLEENLVPSNNRNWVRDTAVLPYAEFRDDTVVVRNIRNCAYQSDTDFVVRYYDRAFDLKQAESVDFLVVPFQGISSLAHTMLSFGFANGDYLAVSVEARLEQGEKYSPVLGGLQQYELIYVLADERDVVVRRTLHRASDVYLYPTVATPQQAREVFVDVMRRVNKLFFEPEFYDTLTNNCTSNIVAHVNHLDPGRIPYDPRIMLTGLSDQLAFQVGLIRAQGSFETTKRQANITQLANRFAARADFSSCIRR
jgi:hypothetical protein